MLLHTHGCAGGVTRQTPRAPAVPAGGSPSCCGSVRSFPACLLDGGPCSSPARVGTGPTPGQPACSSLCQHGFFKVGKSTEPRGWLRDIRKARGSLGGWATCQGHVTSPRLLPSSLLSCLMQRVAQADGDLGNVRATLLCAGLTLGQAALVPLVCVPAWGERPGLGRRGPS